ncbi:MAG TPA: C1 family peptidase [Myxococcota bacterium]|nr:C1 family peptidase [Myxococcota bacterium]HRY92181.1 C1 family peptidase [Myxococcota bacterium]HSA21720.1 C1 family peptidase [Myxococcota bacterium]
MGKRILNVRIKSRDKDKDWRIGDALGKGAARLRRPPSACDLRKSIRGWEVCDQGDTGACIGFSLARGVLHYHLVKARKIRPGDRLSPRFIWMAVKETDTYTDYPTTFIEPEGTEVKQALRVVRKYGCVLERELPMSGRLSRRTMDDFYTRAARLRIASYRNLDRDLDDWRRWLAFRGPIMISLNVDRAFEQCDRTDWWLRRYRPRKDDGGHAACLVGYGPGYFILRNSWGRSWGKGGYAHVTDEYARAAFEDAYGVVV